MSASRLATGVDLPYHIGNSGARLEIEWRMYKVAQKYSWPSLLELRTLRATGSTWTDDTIPSEFRRLPGLMRHQDPVDIIYLSKNASLYQALTLSSTTDQLLPFSFSHEGIPHYWHYLNPHEYQSIVFSLVGLEHRELMSRSQSSYVASWQLETTNR